MSDNDAENELKALAQRFMQALAARSAREVDRAREILEEILKKEPRLPEPHLELAHIHLEAGRLPEAEVHAREGLSWLDRGGQWVDNLQDFQIASLAHGLLGEVLSQKANTDEVVFGDPQVFVELLAESRRHFQEAATRDPENAYAGSQAFFLSLEE